MSPDPLSKWLQSRPPTSIQTEAFTLRRWSLADAGDLNTAIVRSLDHLAHWLSWANNRTGQIDETEQWISEAVKKWDQGTTFDYGIVDRVSGSIVGGIGMDPHLGPGVIEIGYWVHVDHTRQGIATAASRQLVKAAFAMPEVKKVAIRCDEGNAYSASVARKLGFGLSEVRSVWPPEAPGHTGREMVWLLERAGDR